MNTVCESIIEFEAIELVDAMIWYGVVDADNVIGYDDKLSLCNSSNFFLASLMFSLSAAVSIINVNLEPP